MDERRGPDLKHPRQQVGIEYRYGTMSHQFAFLQAEHTIGMRQGQIKIMDREDNQHPARNQLPQQLQQLKLVMPIQAGQRFIK